MGPSLMQTEGYAYPGLSQQQLASLNLGYATVPSGAEATQRMPICHHPCHPHMYWKPYIETHWRPQHRVYWKPCYETQWVPYYTTCWKLHRRPHLHDACCEPQHEPCHEHCHPHGGCGK